MDVLSSLAELARQVFGAAAASVAVLEPDDEHLRFVAASGAGADDVVGLRLPVTQGIAGWVVSSGGAIAVDDVRRDPRFAVELAESTGYVPGSILAAPIEMPGAERTAGVFEVLDRSKVVGRDDLALLTGMARHAASCLAALEAEHEAPGTADAGQVSPQLLAGLGRLDSAERAAAESLLATFVTYVGRNDAAPGVV